jgi:hypothetical protein
MKDQFYGDRTGSLRDPFWPRLAPRHAQGELKKRAEQAAKGAGET